MPKLEYCESQDRDITILDTNGKYSYAWFMFQRATFDNYGKLYDLPHDDIHSYSQQYAIAEKMLENGGWRNWLHCAEKIGLDKASISP